MQANYTIAVEDYIAYNLFFSKNDRLAKRRLRSGRIRGSFLILVAGALVGYLRGDAGIATYGVFIAAALAFFLWVPRYVRKNMEDKVRKMIANAPATACGQKTMTLGEREIELTGEGEHSRYAYKSVQKILSDEGHDYIYVGPVEALILPRSAFAGEEEREAFFSALRTKVEQAGGRTTA